MTGCNSELPDDWFEFAPGKSIMELKKHYEVSTRKISYWRKWTGVKGAPIKTPPPRPRAIPDDFADMCQRTTKNQLAKYYRASPETINRWINVTGLIAKPYSYIRIFSQNSRQKTGHLSNIRTKSIFDEAADVLRRERFIVHRCTENGAYAQVGEFYRVGNVVCSPDELLQRADRYRIRAA